MNDEMIQKNWDIFKNLLLKTKRQNIENLIDWLDKSDFKYAPASTQYHNSFRGGLLQHSLNVYYVLIDDFAKQIEFFEIPEDTIILVSLLHDVCKVNCYGVSSRNVKNESGQWVTVPYYTWNDEDPLGHAEKSIINILEHGVYLTKNEQHLIRGHMGFTEHDDLRRINLEYRQYPFALILHWADAQATFLTESYDGPEYYIKKHKGRSITESLNLSKSSDNADKTINILGMEYKLAPEDSVVDDEKIIEVTYQGNKVKVYSPYGDGLPF